MPTFMENALSVAPSFKSFLFPPNEGKTEFNPKTLVGDFLSSASLYGLGQSQRFILFIESPWLDENFDFRGSEFDKRLMMRAFSVNVPSKYMSTLDRDIGGPKRKVPYTTTFDDDLTIQFYNSPFAREYMFMQKWMDGIIDPVTRYVSFYDDYAKHTKITLIFVPNHIKKMSKLISLYEDNALNGIRFTEVYPRSINVNGGTLEWGSNGKPSFTNVSFAFREAVDISTYDDRLLKALYELRVIDADIQQQVEYDQWAATHPEEVMIMNELTVNLKNNKIPQLGGAENFGIDNQPANGAPIADQGRVINYQDAGLPPQNNIA
jgi:hypothetical protein